MKKLLLLLVSIISVGALSASGAVIKSQYIFDGNNIRTNIWNTGVLFQELQFNNTPGFEWPKNSGKNAIFTSGLSIACMMNGNLRMANATYGGEYQPGYIDYIDNNGPVFKTNTSFRLYKIKAGDTQHTNLDYANWGLMVPYGAPYDDINKNGTFELNIDKPGVPGADQTIFVCLTDADPNTHSSSEGFSGGTLPVFAEVHITLWGYNLPNLNNILFTRYEIINKSGIAWKNSHFGLFSDSYLGKPDDDYIGCDSALNLSYTYNADNIDNAYGENPPAIGFRFLKTPLYKGSQLGMTAFNYMPSYNHLNECLNNSSGNPLQALNILRGNRTDSSYWLNPTTIPPYRTNYCFSGNPEDSSGWTEYKGIVCRDGSIMSSSPGNKRAMTVTGSDSLTIQPNRKFNIVFATVIEKGSSNLNSVTTIKSLSNIAKIFYERNFNYYDDDVSFIPSAPQVSETFKLSQNYPNPFNPATTIKFQVPENTFASLRIYDVSGKEITTILNENILRGEYEYQWNASGLPSGIYFYKLQTEKFSQTRKMILVK
jgi:hypothetical protein